MQKIKNLYKEVKQETLKITWPTKPEVITTTIMQKNKKGLNYV